jgi:hypothetical protein
MITLVLSFLVMGVVAILAHLAIRAEAQRQRNDAALHIKPPRPYIDADGYGGFRDLTADAVRRHRSRP